MGSTSMFLLVMLKVYGLCALNDHQSPAVNDALIFHRRERCGV